MTNQSGQLASPCLNPVFLEVPGEGSVILGFLKGLCASKDGGKNILNLKDTGSSSLRSTPKINFVDDDREEVTNLKLSCPPLSKN